MTTKPDPASCDETGADCGDECIADPSSFRVATAGHDLMFYPLGQERIDVLVDLIDGARTSLHAFYFAFEPDKVGVRVRDALIGAARRGVDVRLYIDAFGSSATEDFFAELVEAGGRFELFSARWTVRYLVRNHQKFAIVDGAQVMTGGFNISDEYFAKPADDGWCDLGVLVTGPVVERFIELFATLDRWIDEGEKKFIEMRKLVRDWDSGDGPVQLLLGGPTAVNSDWSVRLKQDLATAKQVDIVTAYFAPPRSMRRVLRRTAKKAKVRLIVPSQSDAEMFVEAARMHYSHLVRAGVHLHEYQPCKLHMKLFVVDDVCFFGSANMDMRSIRLNMELLVRIEDAELAARLRELIDQVEAASTPINVAWLRANGGLAARVRRTYSALLVRLVDYRVSRALNLGRSAIDKVRPRHSRSH